MRVAILQSNFLPWRGYFDLMDDVDVFIVYDDVQYTKSDWRNRNKLKTRQGTTWLTVPVKRDGLKTLIKDARIDWAKDWTSKHKSLVTENYQDAPYFEEISSIFFRELDLGYATLSTLNVSLLKWVASYLRITARFVDSAELESGGSRTERLVALVKAVGGTMYLSGPSAQDYLDQELFKAGGIVLSYKTYDYDPYPQQWGPFEGGVSILDLLMNVGPNAVNFMKSRSPNVCA